jgi:hypothetical protein
VGFVGFAGVEVFALDDLGMACGLLQAYQRINQEVSSEGPAPMCLTGHTGIIVKLKLGAPENFATDFIVLLKRATIAAFAFVLAFAFAVNRASVRVAFFVG